LMPWLCRAYAVVYLLFIRTNYMDILRMKHQIAPEMPSTFDRRKCKKMGKKKIATHQLVTCCDLESTRGGNETLLI
ncbi:MAG: hypothetical protein KDC67_06635, partial [Ignavibacteriae bacterium]|nr:hypothetical protein [Ignavibacteriota bacterium]